MEYGKSDKAAIGKLSPTQASFANPVFLEPVDGVQEALDRRRRLRCKLCKVRETAIHLVADTKQQNFTSLAEQSKLVAVADRNGRVLTVQLRQLHACVSCDVCEGRRTRDDPGEGRGKFEERDGCRSSIHPMPARTMSRKCG